MDTPDTTEYKKPVRQQVDVDLYDAGDTFSARLNGEPLAPASLNVMSQSARALAELGCPSNTLLTFKFEGKLVGVHSLEHLMTKGRGAVKPLIERKLRVFSFAPRHERKPFVPFERRPLPVVEPLQPVYPPVVENRQRERNRLRAERQHRETEEA
jgi:hypothetical protein